MRKHWVVLQHVGWEGPGIIAKEAEKRSCEVDSRRLDHGDPMPDADDVDGLVVMGGPLGAYEEEHYPFLVEESGLLGTLARRGAPVLGVCLGAQLLAKALGAEVFPGHGSEIGFGRVKLTTEGQEDPLFADAGETLPVFHWHGDTFTLPDGAELLASSAVYPHQAFRFGNCAYGLQFHVEPNAGTWAAWRDHLPKGLLDNSEPERTAIEIAGSKIIARFFDHAMSMAEFGKR